MFIAVLLVALLQSGADDPVVTEWTSYVFGQCWAFPIHRIDIEQSPVWLDATTTDPPLMPSNAVRAARLFLRRWMSNADAWRLGGTQVQPVGYRNVWVYLVEFGEPVSSLPSDESWSIGIVVLMNGLTLEPYRRCGLSLAEGALCSKPLHSH